VRVFATGGTGLLGRVLLPRLRALGQEVVAPARAELDLFDAAEVARAVAAADAVFHLATRIGAWPENDRLRTDASHVLVDSAIGAGVETYVFPSITFASPERPHTRSALDGEREAQRFADSGGTGVVLRLGLLDGPGTGNDLPDDRYGSTLHVDDAGEALALALDVPTGVYEVSRESPEQFERVSGWRPARSGG
jgi:nucleoside-diphosphate-sugar epimerase